MARLKSSIRHTLPATLRITTAELFIRQTETALHFYRDTLGLRLIDQHEDRYTLSADGTTPLLILHVHPGWNRPPRQATALYHMALRLPDRPALARVLYRLAEQRVAFSGFSDHAVSEALYLDDPEGNGLELYRDRPRGEWPRQGDQVMMTTAALNAQALLEEADPAPWTGVDAGTDIGHMHLHVGSLSRAKAFYVDTLGFDITSDWSGHGALFVAAGGYHHHLGLNTWAGDHPQPPETLGLKQFTLALPNANALTELRSQLTSQGRAVQAEGGDGFTMTGPAGHRLSWVVEPLRMGQRE